MSTYIPQIGAAGRYRLKTPFDTALIPDVIYTCIAIRSLSDLIVSGVNPFSEYYTPAGLDEAIFKADVVANVMIITLQAESGNIVYVPSSFINGYPDIGGVPYKNIALVVQIGAFPVSTDFSAINQKIIDLVTENLGVVSEINIVGLSQTTLLSNDTHSSLENARSSKITSTATDYSLYVQANTELLAAREKITELENYIIANHIVSP